MQKSNNYKTHLLLGGGCALIFLFFAYSIKINLSWVTSLDTRIQAILLPFTTKTMTTFVALLTKLASPPLELFYCLLLIAFLFFRYNRKEAIWAGCTVFISLAFTYLVKFAMQRPRPSDRLVSADGYSFPSGHTFGAALVALIILTLILPKVKSSGLRWLLGILACLWVLIAAFTRAYLHVHYPSDTLASMLLAVSLWNLASLIKDCYFKR